VNIVTDSAFPNKIHLY